MSTYWWVSGSGSFSDPNNWRNTSTSTGPPAGPPGPNDSISLLSNFLQNTASQITAGDLVVEGDLETGVGNLSALSLTVIGGAVGITGITGSISGAVLLDGPDDFHAGFLSVSGTSSAPAVLTASSITIGSAGYGSMMIGLGFSAGPEPGKVTVGGALIIGDQSTANGILRLKDIGSVLTANADVVIGSSGTGLLSVDAGTTFDATDQIVQLGVAQNSSGKITVSGTLNTGGLDVGTAGAGDLEVTGGTVQSQDGFIGEFGTGNGIVNVSGAGATWSTGGDIDIGFLGTGKLTIAAGGRVEAAAIDIGDTGQGTLVLDGLRSSLNSGLHIQVGDSGTGEFDIQNGAQFLNALGIDIAENVGSAGTLIVDNAGLDVTGANVGGGVASGGTGSLQVKNASEFFADYVTVWTHGTILVDASLATFRGALANNGVVQITDTSGTGGSGVEFDGAVTGTGEIDLGNDAYIEFRGDVTSGQQIKFQGTKVEIKVFDVADFNGLVSGFARTDIIDLSNIAYNTGSRVQLSGSTLIVTPTSGPAVQVNFDPASLPTGHFALQNDTNDGGTDIVLSVAAADFTGAGTSDVLWINPTNDTVGDWLMNNGTPTWQVVGQGSSTVNIEGFGDFAGNGTSDILWENPTNGVVGDWLMSNNVPTWQQIGQGSTTMNIAGVGDFNGDGTSDILWQNPTNNYVGIWQMQNNVPTWEAVAYGSTTMNIAGIGDFTGNGKDDILWENPTNNLVGMWAMNGSQATWSLISQGSTTMNIVGVGDFTGNGTDDVLWENPTNGLVGFWGMNNGQATSWNVVAAANTSYQVAGVGDYYGNGTDDILWRNSSTGDTGIWQMNNGQAAWHDLGIASTTVNPVKA